jgi:hypothetical protein
VNPPHSLPVFLGSLPFVLPRIAETSSIGSTRAPPPGLPGWIPTGTHFRPALRGRELMYVAVRQYHRGAPNIVIRAWRTSPHCPNPPPPPRGLRVGERGSAQTGSSTRVRQERPPGMGGGGGHTLLGNSLPSHRGLRDEWAVRIARAAYTLGGRTTPRFCELTGWRRL